MNPELVLTKPPTNTPHYEIRIKKVIDRRKNPHSTTVRSSTGPTSTNSKTNDSPEAADEDDEREIETTPQCITRMPGSSSSYLSSTSMTNNLPNSCNQGRRITDETFILEQHHRQPLPQERQQKSMSLQGPTETEFYSKNILIASTLVVTYLVEVAIQIFLVVQCCRYFQEEPHQDHDLVTEAAAATNPSLSTWPLLLIFSSVVSSLLVTLISLVWVFQGMDFSGRICGRLLCYVMHSFLLGLLWRYLKLAFAYDRADLEEFFKLKTIQTYVQSLPLVTIHLAWVLATHQQPMILSYSVFSNDSYHTLSSWLVVVEMLSCVTSLLLLSSTVAASSPSVLSKRSYNNNNNLQRVIVVSSSSPMNQNISQVDRSFSDIHPNHSFNYPGTASTIDNPTHQENDDDNNNCTKSSSCSSFLQLVKWMMSHYHYNSASSRNCYGEPGRVLVLLSRIISLGMLVYKMNYYWTGFIALLHLTVSFAWLSSWVLTVGDTTRKTGGEQATKNKSTSSPSARIVASANDTSCDSTTSSNDSGLVKSEVVMENGMPVVPEQDDHNLDNESNMDLSGPGGHFPFESNSKHVTEHNPEVTGSLNPLSHCFSVIIHPRSNNIGAQEMEMKSNKRTMISMLQAQRHQLLMRVFPLAYVLFWDLSSSSAAISLRSGLKVANAWVTALPVLFVIVENVATTIFNGCTSSEKHIFILSLTSGACLVIGWIFVIASWHFQWRQVWSEQSVKKPHEKEENNGKQVRGEVTSRKMFVDDEHYDDDDSGIGKRRHASDDDESGSHANNGKSHSGQKKETGECLSLCCSSLSHPLNIKRKGHRDEEGSQQVHHEKSSETHNFCGHTTDKKLSFVEPHHCQENSLSACVTPKVFNEYQDQQDLGKLMNSRNNTPQQRHQHHHHQNHNFGHNSTTPTTSQQRRGKEVTKNSLMFHHHHHQHQLNHCSDHTGVQVGEEKEEEGNHCVKSDIKISGRCRVDTMINLKKEPRYQEDVVMMACAKPTSQSPPPVTNNNYTNIKEALTRRISNKSCSTASFKKNHHSKTPRHHHLHQQNNNCMNQEDGESVKGEDLGCGEFDKAEGDPALMMLSSFKSAPPESSSPAGMGASTQNSNKCMPISIKSPLSWLPETCCNDSSGSGSSNSRNTNTLVIIPKSGVHHANSTTTNRYFYCPENYIDLDNEEETGEAAQLRRATAASRDFSIVFFEDRSGGGGTSRSYRKQKQSRTPLPSSQIMEQRTARSANTTPVASSNTKCFLPSVVPTRDLMQQHHPYFHHHKHQQFDYEDDPIDEEEGTSTIHNAPSTLHYHQQHHHPRDRLRNQITGKTYLSDGASLTSLDGLCEIRASTPVEIKKASRVIVNYLPPHHQLSDSKTVSRCLCTTLSKVDPAAGVSSTSPSRGNRKCPVVTPHPKSEGNSVAGNNNIYEKLIDDSYGILICEGGGDQQQDGCSGGGGGARKSDIVNTIVNQNNAHSVQNNENRRAAGIVASGGQKLKILCAKCLENHDPLLTNCGNLYKDEQGNSQNKSKDAHWQLVSNSPFLYTTTPAESDSTDYPSDTEFTTNNPVEDDGQSLSTHFSSVTYSAWHHHNQHPHHHQQPTQLSQFIWAASSMLPNSVNGAGGSHQENPKEFTSLEYVRTWLMASHPRTFAFNSLTHQPTNGGGGAVTGKFMHQHLPPPPLHHHSHQETQSDKNRHSRRQNLDNAAADNHTGHSSAQRPSEYHSNQEHPSASGKIDKRLQTSTVKHTSNGIPSKSKSSSCDKLISKKKRFRQLEKRQRPIGRGASPPAKEFLQDKNTTNNNFEVSGAAATTCDSQGAPVVAGKQASARFQPPPSRKQHPLLFYDDNNMMAQQEEQQKPLLTAATTTAAAAKTTHKKCRDQLDLFHKELETVV